MPWTLRSFDSFDRDSDPVDEGSGDDLHAGLLRLWTKTLDEGLLDDGRPTFTWFELRTPDRRLSLPRDPLKNPALARLRAWRSHPGLVDAIARAHAAAPVDATVTRLLEAATQASTADVFLQLGGLLPLTLPPVVRHHLDALAASILEAFGARLELDAPTRPAPDELLFDSPEEIRVRVTSHGYAGGGTWDGGASSWTLAVEGLPGGTRFRVEAEDTDLNGWYVRRTFDERHDAARRLAARLDLRAHYD